MTAPAELNSAVFDKEYRWPAVMGELETDSATELGERGAIPWQGVDQRARADFLGKRSADQVNCSLTVYCDVIDNDQSSTMFEPKDRVPDMNHSYKVRIRALCADAAGDGYCLKSESEQDFWSFVLSEPRIRSGSLVLMDNGNLRAIWKDGPGTHLGLQFLGGRMVQYVIFKRREATQQISRVAGRDAFEGLARQINAFGLHSLLSE